MEITIAEAAVRLGTSINRVTRAIERLEVPTSQTTARRGRPPRVLSELGFERLLDDLGATPRASSRPREELFVLAAFNMNPFGFHSRRAVANVANVSTTTASLVVDRLIEEGLVRVVPRLRHLAGRVVDATVLEADRESAKWRRVLDEVLATRLPSPPAIKDTKIVPRRFWHVLSNAAPAQLPIENHADFIASQMLLSDDVFAVSWALTHLPVSSIEKTASLGAVDRDMRRWLLNVARARLESMSS
ncbi:MAG: hypothetical protein ACYDEP_06740 [Acidimicrobiales bacterium]|jgi:hypothetical protein